MKCPVIFRAKFEQPMESTMRLPGPVAVEIYHAKMGPPGEWRARCPGTRFDFRNITPQSTSATLQKQIADVHFKRQLTPWEAFDARQEPIRPLSAEDWRADKDGKIFLTESYLEKLKQERTRKENTVTKCSQPPTTIPT